MRIFVFPTRTVKVLISPDNTHKAVLKRLDGIDLIFFVIVDGRKVYSSPDFAPNHKMDFRECLVWDETGDMVILEVTGKRLFGYDAHTCRTLSDSEIMSVVYAREPNDWEYGFEGTWPEEQGKKENQKTAF